MMKTSESRDRGLSFLLRQGTSLERQNPLAIRTDTRMIVESAMALDE